MLIIIVLKAKVGALSIPQSSLSFRGCPSADNKQKHILYLVMDRSDGWNLQERGEYRLKKH